MRSPVLVARRVRSESQRRVLVPALKRDDFWWMGLQGQVVNNWNPWICSNWLTSILVVERDEVARLNSVAKVMRVLDNFVDHYPEDGGCDEGPSYWGHAGASLYECLELLRDATAGEIDVYAEPLIQDIGRFIYRTHIADRYFLNFADAAALIEPSPDLVFGYGGRIGDSGMTGLGAWAARSHDLRSDGLPAESIGRQLPAFFRLRELLEAKSEPPLPRDVWLRVIQVMAARDTEGTGQGFYLGAKGGHNAESHNHNDVGSFVVYVDGKPVLVDAGVETYTAKTFSPRRYELWTMQSCYHNLPTVNGATQEAGRQYAAREVVHRSEDASASLTLDIGGAYPEAAGIRSWTRVVELARGKGVRVEDSYDLKSVSGALALNLITPCEVVLKTPGLVVLKEAQLAGGRVSGAAAVRYDAEKLTASVERIPIEDDKLRNIWGPRLNRIVLKAEKPPPKDTLTIRVTV